MTSARYVRKPGSLSVCLFVPVLTVSEANMREHWAKRLKRKRAQQLATACNLNTRAHTLRMRKQPSGVRLVRLGTRKLDSDNLAGSFKHIRDAIAAWFGFDDGDERTEWTYGQRVVGRKEVGSWIEIAFETGTQSRSSDASIAHTNGATTRVPWERSHVPSAGLFDSSGRTTE